MEQPTEIRQYEEEHFVDTLKGSKELYFSLPVRTYEIFKMEPITVYMKKWVHMHRQVNGESGSVFCCLGAQYTPYPVSIKGNFNDWKKADMNEYELYARAGTRAVYGKALFWVLKPVKCTNTIL